MPKIAASERDAFYEARRRELAEVALRLWAERGFDQTSVAAIAEQAGVAKGTFYLYFESKEALLLEVLRRNSLLPEILALARDLESRSFEQAVRGFVRGAWRHLCAHRELVLVAIREIPTQIERIQPLVERVMLPGHELLADYLEPRIDAGRKDRISLAVAIRALVGMVVFFFVTQEILGAGKVLPASEDEITGTLAEIFLRGVAPPETPAC